MIGTVDNTGTSASGLWRTGVALQHANLFGRDQVGTLAYTTAPDHPEGTRTDLYSLGYRIPFYGIGDSLDFIYGKSNTNSPGSAPTLCGVLGFTGKGDVYGARWNHFLGREGEGSAKLVLAITRKNIDTRCSVGGVQVSTARPTPPIFACVPYETGTPLSITCVRLAAEPGADPHLQRQACRATSPSGRALHQRGRTHRPQFRPPRRQPRHRRRIHAGQRRGRLHPGLVRRLAGAPGPAAPSTATRRWWPASSSR